MKLNKEIMAWIEELKEHGWPLENKLYHSRLREMELEARIKELEAELAKLKQDGCYPSPKIRSFVDDR